MFLFEISQWILHQELLQRDYHRTGISLCWYGKTLLPGYLIRNASNPFHMLCLRFSLQMQLQSIHCIGRSIEYLELRTWDTLTDLASWIFLQPCKEATLPKQVEVVCQRRRIPGIRQMPQQYRFLDGSKHMNILCQTRLYNRITYICLPTLIVSYELSRSWIQSEVYEFIKRETEHLLHLTIRPMGDRNQFK